MSKKFSEGESKARLGLSGAPFVLNSGGSTGPFDARRYRCLRGADTILTSSFDGVSIAADATTSHHGWIGVGWTMGAANYTLESVTVYVTNQGALSAGTLTAGLYSDNGGVPGSLLSSFSVTVNNEATLTPLSSPYTMMAGDSYWFAFTNSRQQFRLYGTTVSAPTGTAATYVGLEEGAPTLDSAVGANAISGVGNPSGAFPAITLTGTLVPSNTPEPGSLGMAATAALVLFLGLQRRTLKRSASN